MRGTANPKGHQWTYRRVNNVIAMQEMQSEAKASTQNHGRDIDVDDLLDDPELERLHAERLAAMQKEAEKRVQLQRKGHGELQEVSAAPTQTFTSDKQYSQKKRRISATSRHTLLS